MKPLRLYTHTHTHTDILLNNIKEYLFKKESNQGSLTIVALFTVLMFSLYGILLYARSASAYIRQSQSIETIQKTYAKDVPNALQIAEQLNATEKFDFQGEATMIARNDDKGFWQSAYKDNITSIEFKVGETTVPEGATDLGNIATDTENSEIRVYVEDDGSGNGTYKCTVISPGKIYASSCASFFRDFSKLKRVFFENFDTINVLSFYAMFYNCKKIVSVNIEKLDTHNASNFSEMFCNCSSLGNINLSNFKTDKAHTMQYLFFNCSSLTELDVSRFNTSQVATMRYMFYGCSNLTSLNLARFDTSKVTNMVNMFSGCNSLNSITFGNGFNTSNVTDMNRMFNGCTNLIDIDVSKFDTSKVTNMENMFCNCSSISFLDVSSFNTSKVTNTALMFYNCSSLTNLDISSFNTAQVTKMSNMFRDSNKLTTIFVSNGWTTSAVIESSDMFSGCNSLVGGNGTAYEYNYSHRDHEYARIDGGPTSSTPGYFTLKTN